MGRLNGLVRIGVRALRSPQGKRVGATGIERVAGLAGRVAGEQHAASIEKARAAAQRGLQRL